MKPNWFVALPVAPGDWFDPLIADAPRTLRAFHRDDLHLTVAFLGGCSAEEAAAAWAIAETLPVPRLEITLAGLVPMGNPREPTAISAELAAGRAEVTAYIAAHRDALLAAASARPDTRPPRPHVTIGRPARRAGRAERAAIVAWARARPPIGASARLDRLALYTWASDRSRRQFAIAASRSAPEASGRPDVAGEEVMQPVLDEQ